tara:strand:+ start:42269 stop:43303 length:1035 start_codon:yes stop_codon:yes gene_type:complete
MKSIFLTALVVASLGASAQSEYNYFWDWDFNKTIYQPIQYTPDKGMETIIFTKTDKNGKIKKYKKTYDKEGNLTSYLQLSKEDKWIPQVEYEYDEDNLITKSRSYKKGKLKNTVEKTRLEKRKPLTVKKTNAKGEVLILDTWKYNANKCVEKSVRYKKNEKLYRTWEYEYRGDCEKSKSILKNKSGKIVKTWSYDCKEEGVQLEKKKNETQVCKWDETTKDYLIKVYQSFDEKGKVYKTVTKYTVMDTLILETATYDNEGELKNKSTYDKDFKKPLTRGYYVHGKERSMYVYSYENGNLVNQTYSRNGKLRNTATFTYKDNRLVERKSFNKKNEETWTIVLSYS